MNDDFLHQYREAPRREFADNLYGQLSQKKRRPTMGTGYNSTLKHLALGFAVVCLALAATAAFSPSARAKFLDVVREVGGLNYTETLDYPMVSPGGKEKLLPKKTMTLEDALQTFSTDIQMPTYLPEGYVLLEDEVKVVGSGNNADNFIIIRWKNQNDSRQHVISLMIKQQNESGGFLVGPGSVTEVSINGQPAALTQGAWSYDTKQWSDMPHFQVLHWIKDGMVYQLLGDDASELIKMAESLP
jgi:hypothetical protein